MYLVSFKTGGLFSCLGEFCMNFKMRWDQGNFFNQQDAWNSVCLI